MQNPHLLPVSIEQQAETKFARVYLAGNGSGDFALHVKLKRPDGFGLHEDETFEDFLGLVHSEECTLNGESRECWWLPLGRRESAQAVTLMNDTFERYTRNLDDVLLRTCDWRYSMKAIGKPHDLDVEWPNSSQTT